MYHLSGCVKNIINRYYLINNVKNVLHSTGILSISSCFLKYQDSAGKYPLFLDLAQMSQMKALQVLSKWNLPNITRWTVADRLYNLPIYLFLFYSIDSDSRKLSKSP